MPFAQDSRATFWLKVATVAGLFLLLQGAILWGTGAGWQKFWLQQPLDNFKYWDAIHYAELAVDPSCSAFYPLWPALVAAVANPNTVEQALGVSIPLSEVIFLGSLPLALFTFERVIGHRPSALVAFVLYALGPNAIFYAIGYTEALFSGLSLLFLLSLHRAEQPKVSRGQLGALYGVILGLSVLLNLVRPALVQSGFAIVFTLAVLVLMGRMSCPGTPRSPARAITLASLIGVGSLVGYSLYGLYCWRTMGNFLGPFQAQVEWGRTLAFRPWLLLFPRSLLMDIHGLYTPVLVFAALGWLLYGVHRRRPQMVLRLPGQPWLYIFLVLPLVFTGLMAALGKFAKRWTQAIPLPSPAAMLGQVGSFTVLYAIAFSGVHSLINFLANSGYLYSTARHYFGSPYAFVALGAMLAAFAVPQLYRLSWVMAAAGLLWLGEQWFHYGTGRWLG
jgi:hypothetical protein